MIKEILLYVIKEWSPLAIFSNLDYYKSEPWAKDVLIEVIKSFTNWKINSSEWVFDFNIIEYFKYFKDKPWALEVLKISFDNFKTNYYNAFEYINYYKNEPWAKDFLKESIEYITNDKNKEYLRIWQIINSLHSESDEIRFMIISEFSKNDLYKLITEWRSEVFTSTYNWIINRLLPKLNWKDIYDLAEENKFEWINTFIEAWMNYLILFEILKRKRNFLIVCLMKLKILD